MDFEIIFEFLKTWYWVPVVMLYVGAIITILIQNRNPTKTVAWMMVIVFVPVLGLLIYYFFGRRFTKKAVFRRRHEKEFHSFFVQLSEFENHFLKRLENGLDKNNRFKSLFTYLFNEKVSFSLDKNHVKLLKDGNEKFKSLFEDIRNAKRYIHLEYYIFEDDPLSQRLLETLAKKVEEGVEVRIIMDGLGSNPSIRFLRKIRALGIQCTVFLPIKFTYLADSNYRNHRKVIVIDDEIGYVGGINIAIKYYNQDDDSIYWRDTSIRIVGDAVFNLEIQFAITWHFTKGESYILNSPPSFFSSESIYDGPSVVGFSWCGPSSEAPYCLETIIIAIQKARRSIRICTPYFVPDEALLSALSIAAASGVEVSLIVPESGDSKIVQWASNSFYKPLLKRGVNIYQYKKGFMHAKTMVIDESLSMVGTVNMDLRSFYINFEVASWIEDEAFAASMNELFLEDLKDAELIDLKEWTKRKWYIRSVESVCRLLAPIL